MNGCTSADVAQRKQAVGTAAGLPVLRVVRAGATPEQGTRLLEALRVKPTGGEIDQNGLVSFLDPARYQHLPTRFVGTERSEEDGQEVSLEGLDFSAIASIRPIDRTAAIQQFTDALAKAELLPRETLRLLPEGHHSRFEAQDTRGQTIVAADIDTSVAIASSYEGIALHGPGAKITATFDSTGAPTQLRYSFRTLTPGQTVSVISTDEAAARCAQALENAQESIEPTSIQPQLVYYAPALAYNRAHSLIPYYACNGSAVVGGQETSLLSALIPATDDPAYVPQLRLDATARGSSVSAAVAIEGGQPPYSIAWASSSTEIDSASERIEYRVLARERASSETLTVTVTDANGVYVSASETLTVSASATGEPVRPLIGGVNDFGAENAVDNQFGRLDKGFVDEMKGGGTTQRFVWLGTNAWEQDFKSPMDSTYVDNADITFYVGHGFGGGFTFEDSSHQDGTLDNDDADGTWGNLDLEWLALMSCQVLRDEWGGMSHFTRWKQEFNGLHHLLGFHTNAFAWSSFSGEFGRNLVDHSMTVRQAWFDAVADEQPDCVQPVVMGVFSTNSNVSNWNDHFWGRGSVGPDIRGTQIGGFWSIRIPKANACN